MYSFSSSGDLDSRDIELQLQDSSWEDVNTYSIEHIEEIKLQEPTVLAQPRHNLDLNPKLVSILPSIKSLPRIPKLNLVVDAVESGGTVDNFTLTVPFR